MTDAQETAYGKAMRALAKAEGHRAEVPNNLRIGGAYGAGAWKPCAATGCITSVRKTGKYCKAHREAQCAAE